MAPVKSAALVFFEEFNGASREQNSNHGGWGRNEKIDDKRLLPGQAGLSASGSFSSNAILSITSACP
jgi:hypothetical protein